jgi:transcriptional regulator with XRE-family HTH domain
VAKKKQPAPSVTDTIGKELKWFRKGRRWTQQELSERLAQLGVTLDQSAIARIERGERAVSLDEAMVLALALGVSPMALAIPRAGNVSLTPKNEYPVEQAANWFRNAWPIPSPYYQGRATFESQAENTDRNTFFWSGVPASEQAMAEHWPELHHLWLCMGLALRFAQVGQLDELDRQYETIGTALENAKAARRAQRGKGRK